MINTPDIERQSAEGGETLGDPVDLVMMRLVGMLRSLHPNLLRAANRNWYSVRGVKLRTKKNS